MTMISGISTRALNTALQRSLQLMQRNLLTSQKEVQTGTLEDIGASLGEKSSTVISLARDISELHSIQEANKSASTRLSAIQNVLGSTLDVSQSIIETLVASRGNNQGQQLAAETANSLLDSLVAGLNTSASGQHILAGINTDSVPINAGNGIPAGVEMDAAFVSFFGFTKSDMAASSISASDFNAFLAAQVDALFLGVGWQNIVSTATDEVVHSRITPKETALTSLSANEPGLRKLVYATALSANFLDSSLSIAAKDSTIDRAIELGAAAEADIGQMQARIGLVQQRISTADLRNAAQRDLFTNSASDLTSVDPYEAATRLNSLLTQIESSYALTQKIRNLSILRYLG